MNRPHLDDFTNETVWRVSYDATVISKGIVEEI